MAGQEVLGRWNLMAKLPGPLHRLASYMWLMGGFWKHYGSIDIILRKLFQPGEPEAYLAPFVFRNSDMTCATSAWLGEVHEPLLNSFNACT